MILYGLLWYFMVFYGLLWPVMASYGPFMGIYRFGLVCSFLAVIDPNSFGLVLLDKHKSLHHGVYKVLEFFFSF